MADPIETYRVAAVELDDFDTTHSNGGVVVWVGDWHETAFYEKPSVPENLRGPRYGLRPYENIEGIKIIKNVSEDVKKGWILTDKTQQLVDSNSSSN